VGREAADPRRPCPLHHAALGGAPRRLDNLLMDRRLTRDQLDARVRAYLEAHPGSTAREIAKAMGATSSKSAESRRVYVSLDRLRARGEVVSDDSWPARWSLAEPPVLL